MVLDKEHDDKTQSHIVLTKGTMVSHYRIVEKIGAGGMGDVYLALDTKLNRKVALKFLPPHLCQNEDCRKRFKREALAAASLDHPNIAGIYEVGEHSGRPFYSMQVVEGQSLREVIAGKDLPINRILEISIQICEGLQAAHDKGIIHRDIKPSNILRDGHGRIRIVDFGLASVKGSEQLTKTGSTLGTIGYMSPEQVLGRETDHRSDLFSLGVVLYELITRQSPFRRESEAATLKAVSDDRPHPVGRYRADAPDGLQAIIDKALEKDVTTRYQHADGILADLMRIKRSLESGQSPVSISSSAERSGRLAWIAAALVVVAALVVLIVTKPWSSKTASVQPDNIMLAVLPFENLGNPEDEYFADGITDEITSRLARLSALRVISRTSAIQYKDTDKGLPQIAEELGVNYILEGTIRWDKTGDTNRVRITPQLIRVTDNTHLWSDRYSTVIDDIFAVQSSIAERVAEELDITLLESERQALTHQPSKNTEAYDYYLKGHKYFTNHTAKDYMNAEVMFQKAIELEPDFASAHAWLSVVHTQIYSWSIDDSEQRLTAAEETANLAFKIDPDLVTAQGALAWFHYAGLRDLDRALEEFIVLREKQPSDATFSFCIALIRRSQGKWQDALVDFARAVRLDPRSATYCAEYGFTLDYLRQYNEAEIQYNRAIELKPDMRQPHRNKSLLYLFRNGDVKAAHKVLEEALEKNDRWPDLTHDEALLDMIAGNYDRAIALLADYADNSKLDAYDSAYCYNLKGSVWRHMSQVDPMEYCYDSARVILERLVLAESDDPGNHSELGLTYAGLGRKQEAIREGRLAIDLLSESGSAMQRADLVRNLGYIYSIVGEYDLATEQLDYLLSIPSEMSVPFLKIWPDFTPMHDHPSFQAVLAKYAE